jgi:hypothetical protein
MELKAIISLAICYFIAKNGKFSRFDPLFKKCSDQAGPKTA